MSMKDFRNDRGDIYADLNRKRQESKEALGLRIPDMGSMISMFGTAINELDKAIKRAATKSGRIIRKSAKAKAPNRKSTIKIGNKTYRYYGFSGALKKSIDSNIRKMGRKSGYGASVRWALAWSAYVGAARKYKQKVFVRWYKPTKKKLAQTNFLMNVRPAWYSHLVEQGFVAKLFGTGKRVVVPARPFLRPALDTNASQIETLTLTEMEVQLNKMAQKQRASK